MTEFYTVKHIDNSRLVRVIPPGQIRECLRRLAWTAVLGACAFACAWQHFQYLQLRSDLQDLQSQRMQAEQRNQELRIELASLQSPMRIDAIARQQLGLTVPLPGQIAPSQAPADAVLAQMRNFSATNRP